MTEQLDTQYVSDLFDSLSPADVTDIHVTESNWIIISFDAPDGDGTHYSLQVSVEGPSWSLYDHSQEDEVYRRL